MLNSRRDGDKSSHTIPLLPRVQARTVPTVPRYTGT